VWLWTWTELNKNAYRMIAVVGSLWRRHHGTAKADLIIKMLLQALSGRHDARNLGWIGGRTARLLALPIHVVPGRLAILTWNALALRRALNTCGIAFAVSLETMRVSAIASLGMNNGLTFRYDLLLKSVRIVSLDALDGRVNIVVVKAVIFAVWARTAVAILSCGKTVAIHLKASALLALASDLVWVGSLAFADLRCWGWRSRWLKCSSGWRNGRAFGHSGWSSTFERFQIVMYDEFSHWQYCTNWSLIGQGQFMKRLPENGCVRWWQCGWQMPFMNLQKVGSRARRGVSWWSCRAGETFSENGDKTAEWTANKRWRFPLKRGDIKEGPWLGLLSTWEKQDEV
jgi:hypothetical protein